MRIKNLSLAALSVSVGLGLFAVGCTENRAESAYHPSPAAWYGYNPSSVDGTHAAQSPGVAPQVPGIAMDEGDPGTTRATAGTGGIGGGPTDGTIQGEHRGHLDGTIVPDDGSKPMSRTGK